MAFDPRRANVIIREIQNNGLALIRTAVLFDANSITTTEKTLETIIESLTRLKEMTAKLNVHICETCGQPEDGKHSHGACR